MSVGYPEHDMTPGGVSGVGPPAAAAPVGSPGPPSSAAGQSNGAAPEEGQRAGPIDFFRRLLRPQSGTSERDPSPGSSGEGPAGARTDGRSSGGSAPSGANGQPGGQRQERPEAIPGNADSEPVTLTRAQLAELVNGEVNRREAKHAAEQDRARRRALREADPIAYADEDRERDLVEEAQAAQRERMGQTLEYYDQHTLIPFLNGLPPEVVEQLRRETGGGVEGLEGRARLVARAQEVWAERIRAEERQRGGQVQRSPRVLQKEQRLREAEADATPEPEVLGPGGGVAPQVEGLDMNTQLRALLAAGRGKR